MNAIVRSSPKGNLEQFKKTWQKLKSKAELGASYYASADDLRTLSKLVGDLGGFATKAYIKTYGAKPHIILKGHPGLRKVLTGTVLQIAPQARILVAGQAPGRKVHESGIPFDDASGDRLREWMGVTRKVFYNSKQIAILPMGFCFPGSKKSGDLPRTT